MATIIGVYNSGRCIGRCDANCYEGTGERCACICGGKNHGAGLPKAIQNNNEHVGLKLEDVERFAAEHGLQPADLKVIDRLSVSSSRKALSIARRSFTAVISDDDLFYNEEEMAR